MLQTWKIGDVPVTKVVEVARDFVRDCAASGVLVLGTHFAGPTAGRIVARDDTYRLAI